MKKIDEELAFNQQQAELSNYYASDRHRKVTTDSDSDEELVATVLDVGMFTVKVSHY